MRDYAQPATSMQWRLGYSLAQEATACSSCPNPPDPLLTTFFARMASRAHQLVVVADQVYHGAGHRRLPEWEQCRAAARACRLTCWRQRSQGRRHRPTSRQAEANAPRTRLFARRASACKLGRTALNPIRMARASAAPAVQQERRPAQQQSSSRTSCPPRAGLLRSPDAEPEGVDKSAVTTFLRCP